MKTNNPYNLNLHEVAFTSENGPNDFLMTTVMRVPGGWIYRSFDKGSKIMGMVFVPFDNEFQLSKVK